MLPFPEGDTVLPTDSEWRATPKWCERLFLANGDKGPAWFPEGSQPLASDSEERLKEKINALLT